MTASFQGYNRKLATSSWDSNVTESPSLRLQFLLLFILLLHGIYLPKVIHPLHLLYCRTEIFLKQLHLLNFSNKNILKGIIIFICFFPKTLFAQWWNSISIVEDYFFIFYHLLYGHIWLIHTFDLCMEHLECYQKEFQVTLGFFKNCHHWCHVLLWFLSFKTII